MQHRALPCCLWRCLGGFVDFLSALVQADAQIATHVIPNLVIPLQKEKKADLSYMNVAKCVGIIIKCHQGLAAGTIAEFSKALKVRRSVMWHATLSQPIFLTERTDIQNIATTFESSDFWGNWPNDVRFPPKLRMQRMLILKSHSDFSNQKDIFHSSVDLFNSPDDEVRGAAAFAAGEILAQKRQLQRILKLNLGNIAVGNLHLFLPVIVKLVQTDKDKRLPALHALKEVVSNCPSGQLEAVAERFGFPCSKIPLTQKRRQGILRLPVWAN